MVYVYQHQTEAIPTIMSDLVGHSPTASLLDRLFSYSPVAADKSSKDIAYHMVPP